MSAVWYLCRKQVKNFIFDLIHKPGKLALYIIIAVIIVVAILSRIFAYQNETIVFSDIYFLHGGYIGVMLLIAIPILLRGLQSGATVFRMSDVHFLFNAPISPKLVLSYGLVKQLLTSVFIVFLLLTNSYQLSNLFGLTVWQTVILAIGVAVMLCAVQMLAMVIYSLTNGRKFLVHVALTILYVCILALAAIYLAEFYVNGMDVNSAISSLGSPYLEYVPIIGWMKGAIFGFILGNYVTAGIYTTLFAVVIGIAIVVFVARDLDFYEDVLESTARFDQIRRNKREGKMNFGRGKVNVKTTGLKRGSGASALFYKHLLEQKRRNRFFISMPSMFLYLINIVFVVILSVSSRNIILSDGILICSAIMSCYIQFFFSTSGDWSLELEKATIYLLPARSFQKLLWASVTTIMRPMIDGILMYTVLCPVLQANPLTALVCAAAYGSMGLLYTACNILFRRLFGKISVNRGPVMIVYMLFVALITAPGIVTSILIFIFLSNLSIFIVGLPFITWNVGISILIIGLCRNMLDYVEYND